jgi:hypothetical protein
MMEEICGNIHGIFWGTIPLGWRETKITKCLRQDRRPFIPDSSRVSPEYKIRVLAIYYSAVFGLS